MRKLFEIPDNVETRLWNRYTANTYEQLANLDATVQDTGLYSGQPILIEKQNTDGSWPRQQKRYFEQTGGCKKRTNLFLSFKLKLKYNI